MQCAQDLISGHSEGSLLEGRIETTSGRSKGESNLFLPLELMAFVPCVAGSFGAEADSSSDR